MLCLGVKIALPSSPRDDMVNEKDIDVLEANDILAWTNSLPNDV